MNLEDFIKDLDPELQEKARQCGSIAELLELAKEHKVPLPDEALEAIAGGNNPDPRNCRPAPPPCPPCQSTDTVTKCHRMHPGAFMYYYHCNSCGYEWGP